MDIRKSLWKQKLPGMVADGSNGSTLPKKMIMAEWDAANKLAEQKEKNAHINEEGASDMMADTWRRS